MNPENQDFENLRRLLKLKRYEQPPPRYFNDFSSQVINRIRAEQPEDRATEAPWLQRFLAIFERKPFVAGAFGAAVCALLVGGTIYSEYGDSTGSPEFVGVQPVAMPVAAGVPAAAASSSLSGNYSSLHFAGSTNPVSIFEQIQPLNRSLTSGQLGQ